MEAALEQNIFKASLIEFNLGLNQTALQQLAQGSGSGLNN
jgi:hypothetical protein